MKLIDKNETLFPPEGYALYRAYADGAYLHLMYGKLREKDKDTDILLHADVFLNDQGREVVRVEWSEEVEKESEPEPRPTKKNWFLAGIKSLFIGE